MFFKKFFEKKPRYDFTDLENFSRYISLINAKRNKQWNEHLYEDQQIEVSISTDSNRCFYVYVKAGGEKRCVISEYIDFPDSPNNFLLRGPWDSDIIKVMSEIRREGEELVDLENKEREEQRQKFLKTYIQQRNKNGNV